MYHLSTRRHGVCQLLLFSLLVALPQVGAETLPGQAAPVPVPLPPIEAEAVATPAPAETAEMVEPLPAAQLVWWAPFAVWDSTPWDVSFELGINGSEGNTEVFNLRVGVDAEFEDALREITLSWKYRQEEQNDVEVGDRLFFDWRHEWLSGESPWSLFMHGTYELDEFRAFDSRVTVDSGVSYRFWESEISEFKARAGAGASREFGGPDDVWVPEGAFGLNFQHQLTERQKLSLSTDFFPDWGDFANYRLNTQADWEVLIDAEAHLSLKLGVIDRYDSTPNGAAPNDLDYSAVLSWSF